MKFLASIRRSKKLAAADDISIDDSSVYTTGLQSRGGLPMNSLATYQTKTKIRISTQLNKQKRKSLRAATPAKSAVSNKSRASSGNESICESASLESYYNNYALPNQAFPPSARFEGGPLAKNISSKTNALASDPPPPLTQIHSIGSSSRSGLISLKSADSKRSTSSKSVDASNRDYPTPRMGSNRKTEQQRMHVVDKSANLTIPQDNKPPRKQESSSQRLLLALGGPLSPTLDERVLRLNLSQHHALDESDGPLPNLCISTASKLMFGNGGGGGGIMLPCSAPSASDKSTVIFDNRRSAVVNDDDYNYDSPHADDESTIDVTLGSKINMTDQELMDERNASPGAIRLTAEGLKSHTETIQDEISATTNKNNRSSRSKRTMGWGYDAWKRQQEERKYFREKYEERDEKLEVKILAAKERAERNLLPSQPNTMSKGKRRYAALNLAKRKPLHQSLARKPIVTSVRKKEETGDLLCIAPMETLDEEVLQQDASSSPSSRPSPFGSIRRKKMTAKLIPQELLEAERQTQKLVEMKKKQDEVADFVRIQKRREKYLNQQRELEAKAREERKKSPVKQKAVEEAPATRMTEEASTNSYLSNCSKEEGDTRSTMSSILDEDTFTISTTTSSQPCVVCLKGERTHIAMPCMHYSFCEDCVESMQCQVVANCPVCKARRVSFTKVFF